MEKVREFLNAIAPIDEKDWHFFLSRMELHTYKKKTILLEFGKVENHVSYVEEGIIRHYIPKEENDLTFGFSFENEIVSAYDSFITNSLVIINWKHSPILSYGELVIRVFRKYITKQRLALR